MAVCPNGHDSVSDDFCDLCGMRIASPAAGPPPAAGGPGAPAGGRAGSGPVSADEPCPNCDTPRTGQFCEACGYNFAAPRLPSGPPPPAPVRTGSYSQPAPAPGPGPGGYSQPAASPGPGNSGYSWSQPAPSAPSRPSAPATLPPPVREPAAGDPPVSSFPYPQATWTAIVGADHAYYERVQAVTGPEGAAVTFPAYYAERRFQLVGNQMRIGRRSVSRGLAPEIDLTGPPADPGISRLHAVLIGMPDGNWAVLDPGSANGTLVNGAEIGVGDQVPLRDGDRINLGAWTAITVHRGLRNSEPAGGRGHVTTNDPRH
jgi:pSer/pThr/pTyr-binding forkhead associated (FHA) protein